jgi:hypothetical protein
MATIFGSGLDGSQFGISVALPVQSDVHDIGTLPFQHLAKVVINGRDAPKSAGLLAPLFVHIGSGDDFYRQTYLLSLAVSGQVSALGNATDSNQRQPPTPTKRKTRNSAYLQNFVCRHFSHTPLCLTAKNAIQRKRNRSGKNEP